MASGRALWIFDEQDWRNDPEAELPHGIRVNVAGSDLTSEHTEDLVRFPSVALWTAMSKLCG